MKGDEPTVLALWEAGLTDDGEKHRDDDEALGERAREVRANVGSPPFGRAKRVEGETVDYLARRVGEEQALPTWW